MSLVKVNNLVVIEWYDGIISGIISNNNDFFWLSLVGTPFCSERIYIAMSIQEADASYLDSILDNDNVDELLTNKWRFLCLSMPDLYLLKGEVREGGDLSSLRKPSNSELLMVKSLYFPCIEFALESNIVFDSDV